MALEPQARAQHVHRSHSAAQDPRYGPPGVAARQFMAAPCGAKRCRTPIVQPTPRLLHRQRREIEMQYSGMSAAPSTPRLAQAGVSWPREARPMGDSAAARVPRPVGVLNVTCQWMWRQWMWLGCDV